MMWRASLKPLVAIATILLLATAGVAVQGRQEPVAEATRKQTKTAPPPAAGAGGAIVPDLAANRAIARKQLAMIDEAWALLMGLAGSARIDLGEGQFSLWGRRRLEALGKAGVGKAEIVAALEKYLDDLKAVEAIAKERLEAGGTTRLSVYEFQFLRMEAEIWLNEENAR